MLSQTIKQTNKDAPTGPTSLYANCNTSSIGHCPPFTASSLPSCPAGTPSPSRAAKASTPASPMWLSLCGDSFDQSIRQLNDDTITYQKTRGWAFFSPEVEPPEGRGQARADGGRQGLGPDGVVLKVDL